MSKLGWLAYWTARVISYFVHNWQRGWHWQHRQDYNEPAIWNEKGWR